MATQSLIDSRLLACTTTSGIWESIAIVDKNSPYTQPASDRPNDSARYSNRLGVTQCSNIAAYISTGLNT
ncbi:MAG: hypothetical protein KME06_13150 [Kastovskya adunca ATA6-11-RM4]|nr:hypothetical protein [Kastovskya adunca ATA6-11-RM4]